MSTRSLSSPGHAAGSLVALMALGALLAGTWQCVSRTHRHRLDSRPEKVSGRLQTWEGEGGRPWPEPASDTTTPADAPPPALGRG
jgi:hypothetical protein